MEIINVQDQFYILASSSMADQRTRVLKHGDSFGVFDRHGDVQPVGMREQGLYYADTRFLSRLALRLGKVRPLLLSSTVTEDNILLTVDLTNPDAYDGGSAVIQRGLLHLSRAKLLFDGCCYERLLLHHYTAAPIRVTLALEFDADYADIFEVRGTTRARRGERLPDRVTPQGIVLSYRGLDGTVRSTHVSCTPRPNEISGSEFSFEITLHPNQDAVVDITIACELGDDMPRILDFDEAYGRAKDILEDDRSHGCGISTRNAQFNAWLDRADADFHMMITHTPRGPYPYAGIPWFSTEFGRDGIIAALESLWVNPEVARGVLSFLAATQAREADAERDAEPGKILHEARRGEMAVLREVPFGMYYGSVDATPLFVLLAGEYYRRTADAAFIDSIWPNVELALAWIDRFGDVDGDGFVEYWRHSSHGLVQQGWKDSHDSIFHQDGRLAEGPIALCEVQGYVYAAKLAAAELAEVRGDPGGASRLRSAARELQERFEQVFWLEELGTYALALDGAKRPCRVRTSNAGQCLFTGIASPEHARVVGRTLLAKESFSAWGIRTVATGEARYNPMSYHNGSVWPHDNALIALGLARYRMKGAALEVLTGLYDASVFMELHRLPELFCGFGRQPGVGPTLYPVACSPQAWSVSAVYALLQACLGLSVDATERRICFSNPVLPNFLPRLYLHNLQVGDARLDLALDRHAQTVGINVTRRTGEVEVVTIQ